MPLTLQHDAMQCGIACLSMVFGHYGRNYSIEYLEQFAQADSEGMSLLGLAQTAENLGLHAVSGRSNIMALKNAPLPAILHWNQNHYVVLDKISRNGKKFRILDPGAGAISYTEDEFKKGWISTNSNGEEKGVVMFLTPTPQFFQNFLTGKTLNAAFSLLSFVVFGCVLFYYSVKIFMIFLLGSALYGLWSMLFLNRRKVLDYITFAKQADANNKTYQFITSVPEIKLQNCGLRRRYEWEDSQAEVFEAKAKSLKLQQLQEAGGVFVNQTKNIVITIIAATSVIAGDMTLGMMMAVQYIMGLLNSPVEQLMDFFYSVQDVKISLERINEIHEKTDENYSKTITQIPENGNGIEFKNLDFKYNIHRLTNTLENINITFPLGKQTAIVGASGSGKTTLIKLMLGFYHPTQGEITVNGANLGYLNLDFWRKRCGVVMQEGVIFSETIARNIAVGDGEIDRARLVQAAETACIFDFIMSLPLKFNTQIGADGIGLSQGQKQRILIARAVYKNPDFIFLDEATNALDAENERKIVENLSKFYKNKTVIVAAHRLSTVKNADQIIVLDNGKITETGTHKTLSAKKGLYYNLVKNQLELGC